MVEIVIGILICSFLAGLVSVAMNRANGHGEFHSATLLIQLSAALDQLQMEVGELPTELNSEDFNEFVSRVYGTATNSKSADLDRKELVTFFLNINTWPIEKPAERSNFVFFEFNENGLRDDDDDGWLEFYWHDDRVFVYRNGEIALFDEENRTYQFAE